MLAVDDTQEAVRRALTDWSVEPTLAAVLDRAPFLILDERAERIVHAPVDRAPLLPGVVGGRVLLPAAIAGEIRRALGHGTAARLVRLRLDRRRLAPPQLCLVARQAGPHPLLLLAAAGHATPAPPGQTQAEPVEISPVAPPPGSTSPDEPATPRAGDRFVWRSDAADVVSALSGPAAAGLSRLKGGTWSALAATGILRDAGALLGAIEGRGTFRGVHAVLVRGGGEPVALELSGAPLARGGRPFEGFGGFGLVRAVPALPVERAGEPKGTPRIEPPPPRSTDADGPSGDPIDDAPPRQDPVEPGRRDHRTIALAVAAVATAARFGLTWAAASRPVEAPAAAPLREAPHAPAPGPVPRPAVDTTPGPVAVVAEADPAAEAAALSHAEHDAFREIARTLNARFAGDPERTDAPQTPAEGAGAVTPFPVRTPDAAFLAGLPVAVLVHRDGTPLAVNRRLLDLSGHADLAALDRFGLDRVFGGSTPSGDAGVQTLAIETADGSAQAVAVEGSEIAWGGAPATCLVLRPAAPPDDGAERAAAALAAAAQAGHAAEARAALDSLDDGVVTLDGAGRVVALNRAAARLFACAPREVVGSGLAGLLGPSADADALTPGADTRTEIAGRTVRLRIAATDLPDRRVAILTPPPPPVSVDVGPTVLAHLAREVRPPLDGIVSTADAMLAEEAGSTGSADRRDRLGTIRSSGEHVRGLVADFSELAALGIGTAEPVRGALHLNELVGASVDSVQTQAASGRTLLRTSLAADLPAPQADAASLRRAAQIVIAQAVRRAGAGGQVIVSTQATEPGTVALRIRDTGSAMAPTEIAALDAFRADAAAGVPPGTGATLPLARALVEANGGRIRLSSRDGEGTLVEILLPVRPASAIRG